MFETRTKYLELRHTISQRELTATTLSAFDLVNLHDLVVQEESSAWAARKKSEGRNLTQIRGKQPK